MHGYISEPSCAPCSQSTLFYTMRIVVCVLLAVAGLASGRVPASFQDPATLSVDASPGGPPSAGASHGAAAAAPAAAAGRLAPTQQNLGPNFFGPGLNNPLAVPVHPLVAQQAQRITAANPNLRVFVDIDGSAHFTDQFGREVEEVLDEFGRDVSDFLDIEELHEQLLRAQRQQLNLQLLQQFNTNPTPFDQTVGGAARTADIGGAASAGGQSAIGSRFQQRPFYTIVL
nr:uncharacterized protein LOC128700867 [Cherax quadricarinatus]